MKNLWAELTSELKAHRTVLWACFVGLMLTWMGSDPINAVVAMVLFVAMRLDERATAVQMQRMTGEDGP
jgi:hypothetical protein